MISRTSGNTLSTNAETVAASCWRGCVNSRYRRVGGGMARNRKAIGKAVSHKERQPRNQREAPQRAPVIVCQELRSLRMHEVKAEQRQQEAVRPVRILPVSKEPVEMLAVQPSQKGCNRQDLRNAGGAEEHPPTRCRLARTCALHRRTTVGFAKRTCRSLHLHSIRSSVQAAK